MSDKLYLKNSGRLLHFVEFMQMCADSGYISESTAREMCLFAKYQGGVEAIPAFPGDHPDNNDRFTDLLAFTPPDERSFDNYVVTEENSYAVELARTVALIPRIWKSISPILFHAGTGQGKTHLLSAIASTSRQNSLFLNLNDLRMGYRYCVKTNKESHLLSWIVSHNFLLLDDLHFASGDIDFQHFLCSVFNRMPQGKSAIVLCSNSEVESLRNFDSTFYSRVSSGISVELKAMDINGRTAILERMFSNTGFGPGADVINYIATTITLNIRTLKAAGRAVLAHLLASPSRNGISLDKVTSLLNSMNLCDPLLKSDAAASATQATAEQEKDIISPYIVVDIDDDEEESEDELKFKQAIEAKRVLDTDEAVADSSPIDSPAISSEIIEEDIPEESGTVSDSSSKEHSINMIESATTVNSQIEALKMAAEKRIQQLEIKNPDSSEIAKLRFAIVFLDQGKIESAMLALK